MFVSVLDARCLLLISLQFRLSGSLVMVMCSRSIVSAVVRLKSGGVEMRMSISSAVVVECVGRVVVVIISFAGGSSRNEEERRSDGNDGSEVEKHVV